MRNFMHISLVLLLFGFGSCKSPQETSMSNPNRATTVKLTHNGSAGDTFHFGTAWEIDFTANAEDPDGGDFKYLWKLTQIPTGSVVYQGTDAVNTLKLHVTDGWGTHTDKALTIPTTTHTQLHHNWNSGPYRIEVFVTGGNGEGDKESTAHIIMGMSG